MSPRGRTRTRSTFSAISTSPTMGEAMEDLFRDALLKLLSYFHNPELVGSLLLLYVIHTVSLTVNIPHALLNGLKVIIAPTEEAVLRLRPDAKGPRPEPLRQKEKEGKDPDAYDKMNALGLVRMEISRGTLGTLVYFPAYEGMVLWFVVSLGNFFVAQISRCALPVRSTPMGWATLTLSGALVRALWCNVRLVGLLGWDNDHSKFAVLCGFCGFFVAAGVGAMFPPGLFAFDLAAASSAFRSWCTDAIALVVGSSPRDAGFPEMSDEDFMALFLSMMAMTAAGVTASAALPSIRFAQFYQRAMRNGSGASLSYRALLVIDLVLPWVVILVWIRPFPSLLIGEQRAEAWGQGLRVGATVATVLARLTVGKAQLQAFLDGAKDAVLQELREKKVNVLAVRTKFEARFQYLAIAAAQYAAPALTLALALALFLQEGVDGNNPVSSSRGIDVTQAETAVATTTGICDAARALVGAEPRWSVIAAAADSDLDGDSSSIGGFLGTLTEVEGFPMAFWSGISGFLAWWACVSWAVTYAIGVAFWQMFPEEDSVEEKERRDRTTKAKREKGKGKAKAKARGAAKGTASAAGNGSNTLSSS